MENNVTSVKYGLVTWNEEADPNPKRAWKKNDGSKPKDQFLKKKEGENIVRIVTRPFQYIVHQVKVEGVKYPFKIKCTADDKCPLCMMPLKDDNGEVMRDAKGNPKLLYPQAYRWYFGIIDRVTGLYKIIDAGPDLYKKIKKYNGMKAWGAPDQYDIDVNVDSNGGSTGYYTVAPIEKTPLSDGDVKIKQTADVEYLQRLTQPSKVEWVQKEYDNALKKGKEALDRMGNGTTAEKPKAAPEPVAQETEEDQSSDGMDDIDFPPATENVA